MTEPRAGRNEEDRLRVDRGAKLAITIVMFGAFVVAPAAAAGKRANARETDWRRPSLSFRLGSYFSNLGTTIRVDGDQGQGTAVDITDVLKIPRTATIFRVHGDLRLASWFSVEAEYYRINRFKSTTLDTEIVVGDTVFTINETVNTRSVTSYLDVDLKFYLIRRPRWDAGVWIGANAHFMKFSIEAVPSELGLVQKNVWFPVPALGVHFSYTLLPGLYLYGKAGVFLFRISEDLKYQTARFDVSLDYYFGKALGAGVTYAYENGSIETAQARFQGRVKSRANGFQVYGLVRF